MFYLFRQYVLSRRGISVGAGVILAISSFPGIAIAAPVFPLGPNATEIVSLGAVEPGEEKEFKISNKTREEVEIQAWSASIVRRPMELTLSPTTANNPRCSPTVKLAAGGECWYRVKNMATEKGGVGEAKVQAEGRKTWFTEIEAF